MLQHSLPGEVHLSLKRRPFRKSRNFVWAVRRRVVIVRRRSGRRRRGRRRRLFRASRNGAQVGRFFAGPVRPRRRRIVVHWRRPGRRSRVPQPSVVGAGKQRLRDVDRQNVARTWRAGRA